MTFDDFGLHPDILKGVHDMGFSRPTPVQEQAIPAIMEGRDVIASAQTGTGKTAAFILPIMHRFLAVPPGRRGPFALVVAPTRELAQQTQDHMSGLSTHVKIKGVAIYGGVPMPPQIRALEHGVDIISATPGRLLDHVENRRIDFRYLQTLVLDEVDRMLDMGFLPDVRRILSLLPRERQNLVFSATIPGDLVSLVDSLTHDPVRVTVGVKHTTPAGIRHAVYPVIHEQRVELLLRLIRDLGDHGSALVFTRTKERADRVMDSLGRAGYPVAVMHGDRDQRERTQALEGFKSGKFKVLVATDVAARGIDIQEISHVINYDVPDTPEAYIHRIGRTGRAEAEGDAFTLMAPVEEPWIVAIERVIGKQLPRVTLPDFTYRKSTIAGSYHPRPGYIKSLRPGEKPGFGRGRGRR